MKMGKLSNVEIAEGLHLSIEVVNELEKELQAVPCQIGSFERNCKNRQPTCGKFLPLGCFVHIGDLNNLEGRVTMQKH